MADEWLKKTTRPVKVAQIDTTAPNVARVWNYMAGGKDNFEADRKAARQLIAVAPILSEVVPATRAFHRRAIQFLVQAGIRQFLDVGAGMPTAGTTHDVAQVIAAGARVVYVDDDPVVLAHARALLPSSMEGVTSYIDADVREPDKIIAEASATLDFHEPMAVILDILTFITGPGDAGKIVRTLRDAVAPGSYLVVMHPASDLDPSMQAAARQWNRLAASPGTLRSRAEVTALAEGMQLVEPGVVEVTQWRPDEPSAPAPESDERAAGTREVPLYGFVARK